MSEKKSGVVKWFNSAKGFGFILHEDKDYFVHFKNIVMDGYKTLDEGMDVLFVPKQSDRGPCATEVEAA